MLATTTDTQIKQFLIKPHPTIKIGPEVAVVSFHQPLNCWLKLGVIPLSPVMAWEHTTTDNNREMKKKREARDGK